MIGSGAKGGPLCLQNLGFLPLWVSVDLEPAH